MRWRGPRRDLENWSDNALNEYERHLEERLQSPERQEEARRQGQIDAILEKENELGGTGHREFWIDNRAAEIAGEWEAEREAHRMDKYLGSENDSDNPDYGNFSSGDDDYGDF